MQIHFEDFISFSLPEIFSWHNELKALQPSSLFKMHQNVISLQQKEPHCFLKSFCDSQNLTI